MFSAGKTNLVVRLQLRSHDGASTLTVQERSYQVPVNLLLVVLWGAVEIDGGHGEHQEAFEQLQRMGLFDARFEEGFILKPGLFKDAGPHICAFDGLTEQRTLFVAKHVVIDVQRPPPALVHHVNYLNTIAIGFCQDHALDEFRMIGQVTKEDPKVLHNVI